MLSQQKMEHTIPFLMALDESLDIGLDTRTARGRELHAAVQFTGTIDKLTYNIKPEQLTAADQAQKRQALAAAQDTPAK